VTGLVEGEFSDSNPLTASKLTGSRSFAGRVSTLSVVVLVLIECDAMVESTGKILEV
jgi:hypothetical protein